MPDTYAASDFGYFSDAAYADAVSCTVNHGDAECPGFFQPDDSAIIGDAIGRAVAQSITGATTDPDIGPHLRAVLDAWLS
jgi:hypothetical protein